MREVDTFHDEVAVANTGLAILEGGTIYDHILAEDIFITNDKYRGIAAITEVLWNGSQHGILMNLVATPHACTVHHADIGINDTVVTNLHIVFYIYERIDSHIVANLRFRTDYCFVANHNLSI